MAAKWYAPPVSATTGGRTATLTSGFDFQHGVSFLLMFHSNRDPKMCRSELHVEAWDSQTDRRTDRSIAYY